MKTRKVVPTQRTKLRRAMDMTQIAIYFILVAAVAAGIFAASKKYMTMSKSDATVSALMAVNGALEGIKANNAGAYPAIAAATKVSAIPSLLNALGGAAAIKDITDWTYMCPAGSGSTITMVSSSLDSSTLQLAVIDKISGRLAPWTATATGTNQIQIVMSNISCQ